MNERERASGAMVSLIRKLLKLFRTEEKKKTRFELLFVVEINDYQTKAD